MRTPLALSLAFGLATATAAQSLPGLPRLGDALPRIEPLLDNSLTATRARVDRLAQDRIDRLQTLVRRHPDAITVDPDGNPARAREVLVTDPDDALIARAATNGFRLLERETALGIGFARFETPRGQSLRAAIRTLHRLGARDVQADPLHFQSGGVVTATSRAVPLAPAATGPRVGMIDAGVAGDWVVQRGFAQGAPRASDHGTAVASLVAGHGAVRGGAPGARVVAADVYGADPAGGSATAIARAIDWLTRQDVRVVTISLVGPASPLLSRVVAAAQARGVILVAAVGNDGPSAPPAYPASYPGVIAVTGIDARGRILIEAGHARHLDYAAPAADMLAANARGGTSKVRGTSFAAPLVAARIASHGSGTRAAILQRVDREAERLGARYGRGVLCRTCRTPP